MMKKLGLSLLFLALSAQTLLAESSRVERFHNQKRHHTFLSERPHRIHHIRPSHFHREHYYRQGPHSVRYRYREPNYFANRCDGSAIVIPRPYYHDRYDRVRYRIGSRIDRLPYGARAVIIDDIYYYTYQNYYFLPQRRSGVRFYVVVDL